MQKEERFETQEKTLGSFFCLDLTGLRELTLGLNGLEC